MTNIEPHLLSSNPPARAIGDARRFELSAFLLGALGIISSVYGWHLIHLQDKSNGLYFIGVGSLFIIGALQCMRLSIKTESKKWNTGFRSITYSQSTNDIKLLIEVQIELAEGQNTDAIYEQLKNSATGPLFALFNSASSVPSREMIWHCIEHAMALKQREISLDILRMEITDMKQINAPTKSNAIPELWT